MPAIARLILKPGREKSLLRRHPWIYSGAVAQVGGMPEQGETVQVCDQQGEFLAWAAYSPQSQIRARVWSWEADETINQDFFARRIQRALARRQTYVDWKQERGAWRLVHGESDGLPGLILDRYADTLVMQALSAGAERWRMDIAQLARDLTEAKRVYERSDAEVRQIEGLPDRCGAMIGDEPPEDTRIEENGLRFRVDVRSGQKTGFYLDQRQNRLRVKELASQKDVLDCFCYTGGFSLAALAGGAKSVLPVDSSGEALRQLQENLELNGMGSEKAPGLEGDVFKVLRGLRDRGQSFDMVILDPPKFAPTAAQAERAARGYKDINLLAFKLLRPGGMLVTFSCSGGVSAELFHKIVAGAALDAGVEAAIVEQLHQAPDHPIALNFPEGAYLKGLVVQI